jgi:hypothetical protein
LISLRLILSKAYDYSKAPDHVTPYLNLYTDGAKATEIMNVTKIFNSLNTIAEQYRTKLMQIEDQQFQKTPPIGGWSYSEVYAHIWDASLLSLEPVKNSIKGIGKEEKTKLIPKLILFFGRLPPGKFKVPKTLESRVRKISKEEAEDFINRFLEELVADYSRINKASLKLKNPHPRLGYFNATQWLRFIEIHLKHHFKQLQRIEKSF